jgi:hypothetical protein
VSPDVPVFKIFSGTCGLFILCNRTLLVVLADTRLVVWQAKLGPTQLQSLPKTIQYAKDEETKQECYQSVHKTKDDLLFRAKVICTWAKRYRKKKSKFLYVLVNEWKIKLV